jgi:hypothetical protein
MLQLPGFLAASGGCEARTDLIRDYAPFLLLVVLKSGAEFLYLNSVVPLACFLMKIMR